MTSASNMTSGRLLPTSARLGVPMRTDIQRMESPQGSSETKARDHKVATVGPFEKHHCPLGSSAVTAEGGPADAGSNSLLCGARASPV